MILGHQKRPEDTVQLEITSSLKMPSMRSPSLIIPLLLCVSVCHVLGTALHTLCILPLTATLQDSDYYPHFIDEKSEAETSYVACSRSHL